MQELGFETVYSYNLGRETVVSPEQVRKGFSQFGIKGNKKGGYNINELLITIREIFRKDELQKVIVVGTGNIGNAVLQYKGFQKNMIELVAAFDIDPAKYRKKLAQKMSIIDGELVKVDVKKAIYSGTTVFVSGYAFHVKEDIRGKVAFVFNEEQQVVELIG